MYSIKESMLGNREFFTFEAAEEAICQAIVKYNDLRPHGGCNYHTPAQAHQMEGELGRRWRKRKPRSMEKIQEKESILVTLNGC
ncbi:integrase core domain-containing protein [Salmonirosea aquatica]